MAFGSVGVDAGRGESGGSARNLAIGVLIDAISVVEVVGFVGDGCQCGQ